MLKKLGSDRGKASSTCVSRFENPKVLKANSAKLFVGPSQEKFFNMSHFEMTEGFSK
jgi:hypothetical protein